MEDTINIKEVLQTLKKRIRLILIITLMALILSAIYTFFIATPQYQADTQILINQSQTDDQTISSVELESNRELISTYNVIITSPIILDQVSEELNIDRSASQLQDQISVVAQEDSQVVILSVVDENPQEATLMANTTAEVFEREIPNIMNIDNVSILSESELTNNQSPVSPQPSLNLAVSLIIGLMVGVGMAFILEYTDQSIKLENDVEKYLKLPVLGSISFINDETKDNFQTRVDKSSKISRSVESKSKRSS